MHIRCRKSNCNIIKASTYNKSYIDQTSLSTEQFNEKLQCSLHCIDQCVKFLAHFPNILFMLEGVIAVMTFFFRFPLRKHFMKEVWKVMSRHYFRTLPYFYKQNEVRSFAIYTESNKLYLSIVQYLQNLDYVHLLRLKQPSKKCKIVANFHAEQFFIV